jgi:hypothetical protein
MQPNAQRSLNLFRARMKMEMVLSDERKNQMTGWCGGTCDTAGEILRNRTPQILGLRRSSRLRRHPPNKSPAIRNPAPPTSNFSTRPLSHNTLNIPNQDAVLHRTPFVPPPGTG